ncbi:MAG: carbohydrate kinase family protein [Patescibacteria group bacterium]
MSKTTKYDFISIGDTVTDVFIRLIDATVHCDLRREQCQICMKFASKVPYESRTEVPAVGNSANAAVAAARLGLKSALVTNLGDDYHGGRCLEALKKNKVGLDFVKVNKGKKTNYHYVLWYEDERTILIKHEKYKYLLPHIGEPGWLYLSSIGDGVDGFYNKLANYLDKHPAVKLAFQPGTFQIKMGADKLMKIYQRTEVFFCNRDEAGRILHKPGGDIRELLRGIQKLGPRIVVVTDGKKGAYTYCDGQMWEMPIYPDPKKPFERTGAGDAFSATFAVALALGEPVAEALRWAPISAMAVVQKIGAQAGLLSRKRLEQLLKKAPRNYKPKVFL